MNRIPWITVVGLAGMSGCGLAADVSGHTHEVAQREAEAFLKAMHIDAQVRCADMDSDGDGYVSCHMVTKDGHVEPLECAGSFTINSGCRPPKAVVRAK